MPHRVDEDLRAAGDGEESRFTAVITSTHRDLRLFVMVRLPNPELCEEVVQATYVAAFEQLRRGNIPEHGLAWLRGIARRQAARVLDEMRRRERPMDDLDLLLLDGVDGTTAALEAAERQHSVTTALHHCLGKLPSQTRQVLEGAYVVKESHKRLAQRIKKPAAAIGRLLFHARSKLRTCLQGQGVVP